MAEFIGSRISLVSKSDIRYVGTLHEINSESSTVALENVSSFGTEGRKGNPEEEIPPSDSVYEYIVFRGSDVKDLRIEEAPAVKENKPPQVPNDPAILGSGTRPAPQAQAQAPGARPNQQQQQQQGPPGPPQFPPHSPYPPQFYPPPPGQWGRGGPPPGPGYPGMPYGVPPGWYPPQGFPPGGPFPYGGFPPGPPGQQFPQQPKPAPIGDSANKQQAPPGELSADKPTEAKTATKPSPQVPVSGPSPAASAQATSKPTSKEGQTSQSHSSATRLETGAITKPTPTGPKSGRIMPAIPLQSPVAPKRTEDTASANLSIETSAQSSAAANRAAVDDATKAATAAVAAAMAKLPPMHGQQANGNRAVDNLTKKVSEMRTNAPIRAPRQPGAGGFNASRGRGRGSHSNEKFEVPASDFDFESSNAKFNKQDLVKEAIAGSPLGETPSNGLDEANGDAATPTAPAGSYNKASSFFDDLSSETKDRAENADRPGGRVWRGEEQKKNVETFGQGSVDNGYRGGFRGRGPGRGGMRGRGYGGNGQPGVRGGRGGHRGGRDNAQTATQL